MSHFVYGDTPESLANSQAAAEEVAPRVAAYREQVFQFIESRGDHGATDREIRVALSMKANTQRPRRVELWEAGRIRVKRDAQNEPFYRKNALGRGKSLVWVVGAEAVCTTCGSVYTKSLRHYANRETEVEEPQQPCMCLFPPSRPVCSDCGGYVAA